MQSRACREQKVGEGKILTLPDLGRCLLLPVDTSRPHPQAFRARLTDITGFSGSPAYRWKIVEVLVLYNLVSQFL